MLARYTCMLSSCVRLSVRLSARLTHAGIVPKRLNEIAMYDSTGTLLFCCQRSRRNFNGVTPNGGTRCRVSSDRVPLTDLECHFCGLKPFYLPYLVKRNMNVLA